MRLPCLRRRGAGRWEQRAPAALARVSKPYVLVLVVCAGLLVLPAAADATTLEYWIAADPVTWNVVPNGQDAIEGTQFTTAQTTLPTVVYRRYRRGFHSRWPDVRSIAGDNDGIPGPLIRAQVGDDVVVHFRNRDTLRDDAHSMHFHGVHYRFGSDGSWIPGFSGPGSKVAPGHEFTYRLHAGEDSTGVWPWHDHSPSMTDSIAGGMYGAMSIRPRGERLPDHEIVIALGSTHGFETINGRAFVGNTPVPHVRVGDTVQWDVVTLGDEFHVFHVHGHRWQDASGANVDSVTIGPSEGQRIRYTEDVPGTWYYHCHVESHMMHGMIGIYRVAPRALGATT